MDAEKLKTARAALRAETDHGLKALANGNMCEATRHLAMGAYYLGHMHQLDPSLHDGRPGDERGDPDDGRFHAFMNRVLSAIPMTQTT